MEMDTGWSQALAAAVSACPKLSSKTEDYVE
jgi:hypothetical protein